MIWKADCIISIRSQYDHTLTCQASLIFMFVHTVFFKVKGQNGRYFLGLLKFQIFFGVLEIPDIFGGEW